MADAAKGQPPASPGPLRHGISGWVSAESGARTAAGWVMVMFLACGITRSTLACRPQKLLQLPDCASRAAGGLPERRRCCDPSRR